VPVLIAVAIGRVGALKPLACKFCKVAPVDLPVSIDIAAAAPIRLFAPFFKPVGGKADEVATIDIIVLLQIRLRINRSGISATLWLLLSVYFHELINSKGQSFRRLIWPTDLHFDRLSVAAQSEVQSKVILITLTRCPFHLPSEDLIAQCDSHLCTYLPNC